MLKKVAIEQHWLPILAPLLPLQIPMPVVMGKPDNDYPFPWSVYRWIEGEVASQSTISDLNDLAKQLAHFLSALQGIDPMYGPEPGAHNFYRGGLLAVYDEQTRQAIEILGGKINTRSALSLWEQALKTSWQKSPVWIHGDVSLGNILLKNGKLYAVIDFGGMAVGDPACDTAILWTLFDDESRKVFQQYLSLDEATWLRGKAWALWKALIVAAGLVETNATEGRKSMEIIEAILEDRQ